MYKDYANFKIGDRFRLTLDEDIYTIETLLEDSAIVLSFKTKEREEIEYTKIMYSGDFLSNRKIYV